MLILSMAIKRIILLNCQLEGKQCFQLQIGKKKEAMNVFPVALVILVGVFWQRAETAKTRSCKATESRLRNAPSTTTQRL